MTRRPKLVVDSRTVQAEAPIPVLPPKPRLTDTELEAFLLARRSTMTVVALDGTLTAILIGPKFIDPRLWLGRLVGETALIADADTREHLALQAVVHHHNRLSTAFADQPDHYRPMVKPHCDGGIDLLDWGLGFISGIEFAPRPWKKVTDPRQPGRTLFEPILTLAIGSRALPLSAAEEVARAVLHIRQLFQEPRRKSMR